MGESSFWTRPEMRGIFVGANILCAEINFLRKIHSLGYFCMFF